MKILYLLGLIVLASSFRIDRDDQFIVDEDGLRRVYHGVNVVYKVAPFYPPISEGFDPNDSLSDLDLDNLVSWGQNFIRLYVAWEGVEPVRGQYNYTYLEQIAKIVKKCEVKGITVLLDAHQDVLSRFFCGNGFPDWAVVKTENNFPYPIKNALRKDDNGVPIVEDCLKLKFVDYYLSSDVANTFDNLFHNVDGIADNFASFWGVVADYFKDGYPNVIGYEIINEPVASSPYRSFYDFLYPNVGNNKNLLPLYQKVSNEVRKVDQEKLLFFEPATTDLLGSGFKDSPGGEQFRDREVYSYHIYCFYVDNYSIPKSQQVCAAMDTLFFDRKEKAAKDLKIGKFMTEFGAILDTPEGNRELNFLLSLMEQRFTSWAYWEFKYYSDVTTQANPGNIESFYDEHGQLYTDKVKTLARPYATKICGEPLQSFFEPYVNIYMSLTWKASNKCNGKNTEVFLSREFYNLEFTTTFTGCQGCKLVQTSKSYYEVQLPQDFQDGHQITLVVTQKKAP